MQIEAIYDRGRLIFPEHIRLKHSRTKVTVVIPDEELASNLTETISPEPPHQPAVPQGSIREAIDEILGPFKEQIQSGPPLTQEDYDRLRYEALEEKYFGRR